MQKKIGKVRREYFKFIKKIDIWKKKELGLWPNHLQVSNWEKEKTEQE